MTMLPESDEPSTAQIKRMDIAEFRSFGYLQEVNRLFLHPLGLALEVFIRPDGTETLGGVWDYRDDPEGVIFGGVDKSKVHRVRNEQKRMATSREALLGWVIQPCEPA